MGDRSVSGNRRPRAWNQVIAEASKVPTDVKRGILLRLERWLPRRLIDEGVPLVVLAAMLRDVQMELGTVRSATDLCGASRDEVDLARDVSAQLIANVENAVEARELCGPLALPTAGEAVCEAFEDLARRLTERRRQGSSPSTDRGTMPERERGAGGGNDGGSVVEK